MRRLNFHKWNRCVFVGLLKLHTEQRDTNDICQTKCEAWTEVIEIPRRTEKRIRMNERIDKCDAKSVNIFSGKINFYTFNQNIVPELIFTETNSELIFLGDPQ